MGHLCSLDRVSTGQYLDILTRIDNISTTASIYVMEHVDLHHGPMMVEEILNVFCISTCGNVG
jgi:hypothetical protein